MAEELQKILNTNIMSITDIKNLRHYGYQFILSPINPYLDKFVGSDRKIKYENGRKAVKRYFTTESLRLFKQYHPNETVRSYYISLTKDPKFFLTTRSLTSSARAAPPLSPNVANAARNWLAKYRARHPIIEAMPQAKYIRKAKKITRPSLSESISVQVKRGRSNSGSNSEEKRKLLKRVTKKNKNVDLADLFGNMTTTSRDVPMTQSRLRRQTPVAGPSRSSARLQNTLPRQSEAEIRAEIANEIAKRESAERKKRLAERTDNSMSKMLTGFRI